jgi:hypothetical protein
VTNISQLPQEVNMEVYKGSTFVNSYAFTYADKTPIDLTGAQVTAWLINNNARVYESSTTNGDIVVNGVNGMVVWTIPASVVADWSFNSARYDMELTLSGQPPIVITPVYGYITIMKDITNNGIYAP